MVYNFCAGPAALPKAVMHEAQNELVDWHGTGASIMEFSHRSEEFQTLAYQAEADFREIMRVPDNYKVLFLQGGATAQFAMVPLNLLAKGPKARYVDTGLWSTKAINEATRYLDIDVVSTKSVNYTKVPSQAELSTELDYSYTHYTPNETIGGVSFNYIPQMKEILVADMSSMILSEVVDVSQYGVIYASAQKNIGPAGLTLVVIREDLLEYSANYTPSTYSYKKACEHHSMFNTPPTFAWYLAGLVFKWVKAQGGVSALSKVNAEKASLLYDTIDQSGFYENKVGIDYRSKMNVPFTLATSSLESKFLTESKKAGLLHLKGHRSVGGMRASLYNSMPLQGVQALVDFMIFFERRFG